MIPLGILTSAMRRASDELLPTVIGEAFGGGFYAGNIKSDEQWYKLIVADKGAETATRWKTTANSTPNTDHLTDGVANTSAMVAAGIELHPAASHCIEHRGGGNADWYMPAKNELNVIYQNLGPRLPNCPAHFQSGGAQAFSTSSYWSSTEHNVLARGWVQYFSNGNPDSTLKTSASPRVRPVRRIPFTPG